MKNGFRRRLEIVGSPKSAAALGRALARLEDSPTARERMLEFVALGAGARVSFARFPGSRIVIESGRKTLMASAARTVGARTPRVELNEDVLRMDRAYRRANVPGHLAHELLGHVLEEAKARRAGLGEVYHHYRHNETTAALVGWLVEAELGADFSGVEHGDLRTLLGRGVDAYHASLQIRMPYYALTLSLAEMARPAAVLRRRLRRVRRELAKRGRDRRELARIAAELEGCIRYWSAPNGRPLARRLRAASAEPLLRAAEKDVARRLRRLKALLKARRAGA